MKCKCGKEKIMGACRDLGCTEFRPYTSNLENEIGLILKSSGFKDIKELKDFCKKVVVESDKKVEELKENE